MYNSATTATWVGMDNQNSSCENILYSICVDICNSEFEFSTDNSIIITHSKYYPNSRNDFSIEVVK